MNAGDEEHVGRNFVRPLGEPTEIGLREVMVIRKSDELNNVRAEPMQSLLK